MKFVLRHSKYMCPQLKQEINPVPAKCLPSPARVSPAETSNQPSAGQMLAKSGTRVPS